ncbi:BMP family ABC transporter substrate-binding protein [Glaciibacter superstes]|uniref:BMP family ABC transporter substrate-binding protein n=1 Tax=Glaciibacter superstes TaxID=501023 RepID=UPI0003B60F12|nr:BMP family ABC transporter substrate-binding protein [Glaciibacter superstes]
MHPTIKRMTAVAAIAVLGLGLTGCNASANTGNDTNSGNGESDGPTLILVTPEPAGANEFLQLAIQGIEEAAEAVDGSSRVFESANISKVSEQLDAAIAAKPDVIVAVGFEFVDSITALAPNNPEQQFLFVDACIADALPNVSCAVFREHEAVYLAGVEAGLITESNKVGAVVALDTPQIRRFSDPFGVGAQSVNDAVQFTPLYVGGQNPFNDPGRAKEQALSLANAGVDIVMASSAGGNSGVFDAAKSSGSLAIGVDTNQCPQAPGAVLDNVLKEVNVVISASVEAIVGGLTGDVKSYGLAEGAVTLTSLTDGVGESGCVIADYPEIIEQVKAVSDQIVSGDVTVDDPAA